MQQLSSPFPFFAAHSRQPEQASSVKCSCYGAWSNIRIGPWVPYLTTGMKQQSTVSTRARVRPPAVSSTNVPANQMPVFHPPISSFHHLGNSCSVDIHSRLHCPFSTYEPPISCSTCCRPVCALCRPPNLAPSLWP